MIQKVINVAATIAWVAGIGWTMRAGIGYGLAYLLLSALFGVLVERWRERKLM